MKIYVQKNKDTVSLGKAHAGLFVTYFVFYVYLTEISHDFLRQKDPLKTVCFKLLANQNYVYIDP